MGVEGTAESGRLVAVADVAHLRRVGVLGARVGAVDLVVLCWQGEIRVFEGRCPHQGTLLSEGHISQGKLICRSHQWQFDCRSGLRVGQPDAGQAETCLRAIGSSVVGGQVMVAVDGVRDAARQPVGRTIASLPGPRRWPLVGNLLQLKRTAFHQTLEAWAHIYGPLYQCRLVGWPIAVVSDVTLANELLKARPDDFRRPTSLEKAFIGALSTQGIFMAEGERWRRQRPVIMQSLDIRHLRQFFPTLVAVTERLRRRWHATGMAAGGVDVQSDLTRFTVDVTTSLAFGQDTNTLEREGGTMHQHLDTIFPMLQRRLLAPIRYWQYFKLPRDRAVEKSVAVVYATVIEFIRQGRAQLDANPAHRDNPQNLLQSLLLAVADDKSGFSEQEVADNVLTMLLAGEDTTANSLAWAMYFLAKYPHVQHTLRREIADVVGAGVLDTFEQTRQLPYLDAVINETMRLKPVAPMNILEANRALNIGGLSFRKGESAVVLTRAMAMSEADYPAATLFKPERWLKGDGQRGVANPRSFMPFGSGPRLCPGRSLALLEMKAVLTMVVQHFEVTAGAPLDGVTERLEFTMYPLGLRVNLAARASIA